MRGPLHARGHWKLRNVRVRAHANSDACKKALCNARRRARQIKLLVLKWCQPPAPSECPRSRCWIRRLLKRSSTMTGVCAGPRPPMAGQIYLDGLLDAFVPFHLATDFMRQCAPVFAIFLVVSSSQDR